MSISREEAKIIISSLLQCKSVNGFIDEEENELLKKLKFEFNIRVFCDKNNNIILT